MFFKKSREAKNTLRKEEQQTQIAAIRESLAKAEGCADPGEKLMMLEDLGKDLKKQYDTLIEKRDNGFASNSSVAGTVLSFVGGEGGAGTATVLAITKASAALAVTVTGGMLLPVFPIGLLGGAGMAILVAKTVFPIVDKADFEKNKYNHFECTRSTSPLRAQKNKAKPCRVKQARKNCCNH